MNAFRLALLGGMTLQSPDGTEDETLARRRLKIALLGVLAVEARPLSRDALIALFWPEQEEARARHSLSDALSHLRRVLGPRAISTRRTEVSLTEEARLEVDVLEFQRAIEAGDSARATELYRGPFMDGVYPTASRALEEWSSRQRARLEAAFVRACAKQCEALARHRAWDECAELALRWLAADPLSGDAALYRLNAIKAPGTAGADRRALEEYDRLAERLRQDFGRTPDRGVATLAAAIAERVSQSNEPAAPEQSANIAPETVEPPTAIAVAGEPVAPGAAPGADAMSEHEPASPGSDGARAGIEFGGRWRRWLATPRTRWIAAGAAVGALAIALLSLNRSRSPRVEAPPVVAIVAVSDTRPDTSVAWMAEGVGSMIAAKLSHVGAVDVVAPERVREVRDRAGWDRGHTVTSDEARDLARRVGASWVVTGGLTRGDSVLVLDLAIRAVGDTAPARLEAITAPNVLALADAAAARILAAAGAAGSGPRLADVETASLDALAHYGRYVLAHSERRENDALRELDAAIAADSGFITALRERAAYAFDAKDRRTIGALARAFRRNNARATDWDRLTFALDDAFHSGARERSEALARALVHRYPLDPRSLARLRDVYEFHGRWSDAEAAAIAMLRVDSSAVEAGAGPCIPCEAYRGLADVRMARGDYAGAVAAERRVLELEPGLGSQWVGLSAALAGEQRWDDALAAARRAVVLSGDAVDAREHEARLLVQMRRFAEADSLIREWDDLGSPALHDEMLDIRATIAREEGRFRDANATLATMIRSYPDAEDMALVLGDGQGRLGDYAGATRTFEQLNHHVDIAGRSAFPTDEPLAGDVARAFAWAHALEADAIAAQGDTVRLHVLADSIEAVGARSYFGRDWTLHHYVRGLIAMRARRYAEAEREFAAAHWGGTGWTRTLLGQGRAELALGRPAEAIATLRMAYSAPVGASGRYTTRAELDLEMARAFAALGRVDSAAVYAGYVRRAWRHADPIVARALEQLPATGLVATRSAR